MQNFAKRQDFMKT